MLIDPELLNILVCPQTHQPVALADEALVRRVNENIAAGTARNGEGRAIEEPVDGGLVREDGRVLYPIRDELPIMLIDEAIVIGEGLSA